MADDRDSSSFPTGESAQEKGLPYVPECYKLPTSHRASSSPETANIPLVDFAGLRQGPEQSARVIDTIKDACLRLGFFQVINHGICQLVQDDALSSAADFFRLPAPEKMKFMSNDVHRPVRYGTSLKDGLDKIQFWRVFLKHYAHPLEDWIESWPTNPPTYREKMGRYCKEVRKLGLELMGAITESLGLGPNYLMDKAQNGMQVMAVNCYPPCPNPDLALGLPPHSDYSCLTIVLQSGPGLEIFDADVPAGGAWRLVPELHGTLQVHVGDHFEVLSNGRYKSLVHRATLSRERTRVSVASLHSLGMDEKMGPAEELVDGDDQDQERHKIKYKQSSFRDFLNFLATNDIAEGKTYINTLKIEN